MFNPKSAVLLHFFLIGFHLTESAASFQCLKTSDAPYETHERQLGIGLQVTNRPTHQLMTRIFDIFLREVLHYNPVRIVPIHLENATNPDNQWYILNYVRFVYELRNMTMINLEAWVPYNYERLPDMIQSAGPSITPGRYGWFVPSAQAPDTSSNYYTMHHKIFEYMNNTYYNLYTMDDNITNLLKQRTVEEFRNPICDHQKCAMLIAEFRNDSFFIESTLSKTYINVVWLGKQFKQTIEELADIYAKHYPHGEKRFIVLHWTPSMVIDADIKFTQIILPRCEESIDLQKTHCKYELTPILKYYGKDLSDESRLIYALHSFYMTDAHLTYFQKELGMRRHRSEDLEDIYNEIACNWMRANEQTYNNWIKPEEKQILAIGGIFPINVTDRGHSNIEDAAHRAIEAVNRNATILPGYKLVLKTNDGHCKSDLVMRALIHYYKNDNVLGVLGPACSETVEPIAGISKHMNMMVMSYSADGASFVDRKAYPYFFRTIGSNTEYVDAHMEIMQRLGWNRVSTLTEDGLQYADYMSHMESKLKQNNFTLAFNRKFQPNVSAEDMNEHLSRLKEAHSRIIIAELHNGNAAMAICEAIHLDMTQAMEYIWFLPAWISKDFRVWQSKVHHRCTAEQLSNAMEGHFSIRHTPYGEPDALMQENITIKSWQETYARNFDKNANYVGFAYDAVWAYAIAAHKLIEQDAFAINDLRSLKTINQLTKFMWQTDFNGLSGRVTFGHGEFGGSRISDLEILQWRNGSYTKIGSFTPKLDGIGDELHSDGGCLYFNANKAFNGKIPEDGRYDCRFSGVARALRIDCDLANMIVSITICLLVIFVMSMISFYFWKQRYDRKVRHSAQIMKMFGIDLITPSRNKLNTLDKWEIPKENVVINRRLGEGAFGTVYGGEAQLGSGNWTAVAVKTLKCGASTEDRLDFLAEAEAMKKFNNRNIIKLLGVCLQNEPIYTIMQFMLYGDLKTYLLARRSMVNEKITDESDISPKRLTMYAMDVARGLAYLAEQKYVHRDIACRNCLVNSQRVIKIGDFGMARPTFESDYYCYNRKGVRKLFPVRWMPPETLSLGIFTSASDIWSFGVVLYEVITFGAVPYADLTNNQVLDHVRNGNSLRIPSGAKPPLEGLLKACWSQEASKRPTALDIIDYIVNYPRMLTPCLDCPGTALQMLETDSDEMDLLPPGRQSSPLTQESMLDSLPEINSSHNLRQFNFPSCEKLNAVKVKEEAVKATPDTPLDSADSFSPITPDGYSIMSPLLTYKQPNP
ncbi:uncharacterized protein LOC133841324 [Drosophila sulfurigaster albostrigata]|uniref:uncharacterized protein LOC133841324 n=1 Tax=Drosophila sulfurigaster albostrigata TaxID=89887 RepID=UPI002D21DEF1|nr:uncharacterized protein LOC133841324 [Drosophila sulfurigaster albostrigata]XP_062129717.1 uncharacterized protein LOC133841324 [Drosophila sulfurigaster albostrigata]